MSKEMNICFFFAAMNFHLSFYIWNSSAAALLFIWPFGFVFLYFVASSYTGTTLPAVLSQYLLNLKWKFSFILCSAQVLFNGRLSVKWVFAKVLWQIKKAAQTVCLCCQKLMLLVAQIEWKHFNWLLRFVLDCLRWIKPTVGNR